MTCFQEIAVLLPSPQKSDASFDPAVLGKSQSACHSDVSSTLQ